MAEILPALREEFEAIFIAPFASHRWASVRGRSHWVELEGWQDSMAGPLSSIASSGGSEYVYPRDDAYFAGVNDPVGLRTRLLEWHTGLAAGVEQFTPATAEEAADGAYMKMISHRMRELVEQSCAVEKARWAAVKGK